MRSSSPRFLLTAPASGGGKTTIACAVLQAFVNRRIQAASFKCGPDFIDPMFHSRAIGTPSYQLDSFFMNREQLTSSLIRHSSGRRISVLEGAMGYYDGIAGTTTKASAYEVARLTKTPVVLVVDCKKASVSILALLFGFLSFRDDSAVAGVILNRLAASRYSEMKALIESNLPVKVYGFLPLMEDCSFESRYLGLVQAGEMEGIGQKLQTLAAQAEKSIDLDGLLRLGDTAPPVETQPESLKPAAGRPVIAVARDEAFSFYYQDNLDLLAAGGAELRYFSPLRDGILPPETDGLLLGGGYPELFAQTLSENYTMRESILAAVNEGMPCIAECGGFLYLCEELEDAQGIPFPMVGAISARGFGTHRLGRFGYISLTAQKDNLLCQEGERIRGHEFHYWNCSDCGNSFLAVKPVRETSWECVHTTQTLYAGFPHLSFASNPSVAQRFLRKCVHFRKRKEQE